MASSRLPSLTVVVTVRKPGRLPADAKAHCPEEVHVRVMKVGMAAKIRFERVTTVGCSTRERTGDLERAGSSKQAEAESRGHGKVSGSNGDGVPGAL